jgi:uncharacterized protein YqgC (DUF456 family)
MLARIRGAHPALLATAIIAVALAGGIMLAGCGSEEAEEPSLEITADEVPIVREGEQEPEEPTADEQADEAADEAPEPIEQPESEPEPEPPTTVEPLSEEVTEDEEPGLLGRLGGVLKVIAAFLGKLIFVLILPAAIAGTLLGMPGGLLVFADAVIFSAFHGWAAPPWWVLLILLAIAGIAEAAENLLSFTGVKRGGASNTTGVWVMVGGFSGAIVGGILAPLLASIGALAGPVGWVILSIVPPIGLGMVGGFLGGYFFEVKRGREPEEAKKAGWAALMGRLAGSFAKAMLVAVMAAIVLISTWGALF